MTMPTYTEFAEALRAFLTGIRSGDEIDRARALLKRYDLETNPTMPEGWADDRMLDADTVRRGHRVRLVNTMNWSGHYGTVVGVFSRGNEAWVKLDRGGEYAAYSDGLMKLRRVRKGETK